MAKYELKTKINDASVKAFLDKIEDKQKRDDCYSIVNMMQTATKQQPKMWGTAIVGFGSYHYKYASGHEGDAPLLALSPRKANITLYLMLGLNQHTEILGRLGKHKTGKGCLYIKKLSDVDEKVLTELVKRSFEFTKKQFPQ
ncbi:MAG TPA: DUF1801 domain-containing protein [Candidatus Kapabacteria bacterium]|nr:DUF1801 domain-containing protein [Candidatus Kapabacteria bacterium]HYM35943.1 DUF1801 domain-containing protein [Steroidobacteraceae bacterium]